jgi:hypothetical protein
MYSFIGLVSAAIAIELVSVITKAGAAIAVSLGTIAVVKTVQVFLVVLTTLLCVCGIKSFKTSRSISCDFLLFFNERNFSLNCFTTTPLLALFN